MGDPAVGRRDDRQPAGRSPANAAAPEADAAGFAELRSLIVGPEQRELVALREHLADARPRAREVSRVLPDAIALRANDPRLARALTPPVEQAITASVRRDPRPLADALFPAMGPAIRKAIAHTLASMVESLNRTVEQSVSWRAVQWRWIALRTGRPFGEVVLLHTLQYRVEQVFLVHRETGLLLLHVSLDPRAAEDADQISAMLTAIRDFARDSFRVSAEDALDALRVGELVVMVEQGPQAVLAGVVRGTPPATLRAAFEDTLETIHLRFGEELAAFRGDAAPFERARPALEGCLVKEFRSPGRARTQWRWLLAGGLLLLVIGAWAASSMRDRQRWNDYLERLRAEPGVVVLASARRSGRYFVTGLRDPLAADPAALAAASGLAPGSLEARWEPYQAIHPEFVAARARDLLRPPAGVTITFRDGVLTASGPVTERWIAETERLAPAVAGVRSFQYSGASPTARLKEELEAVSVVFPRGQARITPGQDETLRAVLDTLRELNAAMRVREARAHVEIVGHTDADGSPLANEPLSTERARAVLAWLGARPLDALEITARGVGSASPLSTGTTERDKERNRRVSFRVHLPVAPAARDGRP